jgi:hypothetical protein
MFLFTVPPQQIEGLSSFFAGACVGEEGNKKREKK